MTKRIRCKGPNPPGVLSMYWGRADRHDMTPDVVYNHGPGCDRADMRLLNSVMGNPRPHLSFPDGQKIEYEKSLLDELVERGYDLTTLKFSIRKKS